MENKERADRALLAITPYLQGEELDESTIRDLITDLLHLRESQNNDAFRQLQLALKTFISEIYGGL